MKNFFKTIGMVLLLSPHFIQAQTLPDTDFGIEDSDMNIGGDIFSDFNEDLEASQVMEDERYYRYGRFFSFQLGIGLTGFDGNRGIAFNADPPAYKIALNYFLDFQSSFGIGFDFSKHWMYFPEGTQGSSTAFKFVDVALFRVHFNYRHYLDTSNLGTAITWSNPYFTGRLEYWYETQKFLDREDVANDSGGGLGMGLGFGLEFPVKIKESYINLEFLFHTVNFHNKFTSRFQSDNGNYGIDDLSGNAYSSFISYVFNW